MEFSMDKPVEKSTEKKIKPFRKHCNSFRKISFQIETRTNIECRNATFDEKQLQEWECYQIRELTEFREVILVSKISDYLFSSIGSCQLH